MIQSTPTPSIEDSLAELRRLLCDPANLEAITKAAKEIGKEHKEKAATKAREKRGCKQYKYVTVVRTCDHCGFEVSNEIQLSPKDQVTVVNKWGQIITAHYHNVDTAVTITTRSTSCEHCGEYVSTLDRNTLELWYINLLKHHEIYVDNCRRVADGQKPVLEWDKDEIVQDVVEVDRPLGEDDKDDVEQEEGI